MSMDGKKVGCKLDKDINNCPFCDKNNMECTNRDTKCCFRYEVEANNNNKYVRQERWYEKYYRKNKR